MNTETYAIEHTIEQSHWWFCARRGLFQSLINKMKLNDDVNILDVGTSSGTNLRMLKNMGFRSYKGLDISFQSKEYCAEKEIGEVLIGDVQSDSIGLQEYNLILATDVLEHLDEDEKALSNMYRALSPEGRLLLTVPCFPLLWGPQDIVAQHKRRYKKADFLTKIRQAGFMIEEIFYFNFFLFIPIFFARKWLLWKGKIVNENTLTSDNMNTLLKMLFNVDCWLAQRIPFPFGVSLCVVAKKPTIPVSL